MSKPEFFDTPGYGEIARTRNHYRQALRIGDRIEISGQGAGTRISPCRSPPWRTRSTRRATTSKNLAEAGATWGDVVNVHSYHVPTADDSIGSQHMSLMVDQFRKRLGERQPLWTALGVEALALAGQRVEIEVVAIAGFGSK